MKEGKADLEKSAESLRTALRQQEQSTGTSCPFKLMGSGLYPFSDKFNEENWNLEVTLQELRTPLGDSQAAVQRFESETQTSYKIPREYPGYRRATQE
jgi:hypothetical protein